MIDESDILNYLLMFRIQLARLVEFETYLALLVVLLLLLKFLHSKNYTQ